jgi:hypothetical protein
MSTATLAKHGYNLLRRQRLDPRQTVRYFDDFVTIPVDDTTFYPTDWAIVLEPAGEPTAQTGPLDGLGGWLQVCCDGDSEDECYASSRCEAFIFNTTKELMFEARVKFTAGSTDGKGTFVVGLSDTVAANSIVDAGTLMTSFDGAIFCLEEDAEVSFTTSNASSQTRTATAYSWTNGDTVRLGFYYSPADGTTGKITPIVNGTEGTTHDITISGLAEMHILLGAKTHEGAEQKLEVDWCEVIQRR